MKTAREEESLRSEVDEKNKEFTEARAEIHIHKTALMPKIFVFFLLMVITQRNQRPSVTSRPSPKTSKKEITIGITQYYHCN